MRYYLANVLDTERTCYPANIFPDGEVQEVIEFGITVVDLADRKILSSTSIPVLPVRSRISQYCTDLTGWTYDQLQESGVSFAEACRRIVDEFDGLQRLLVVDSDSDLIALRKQCAETGVALPFGAAQFNVTTVFSLLTGRRKNPGSEKLLRLLGLDPEPVRHRADSDSRATARAFIKVLELSSFKA